MNAVTKSLAVLLVSSIFTPSSVMAVDFYDYPVFVHNSTNETVRVLVANANGVGSTELGTAGGHRDWQKVGNVNRRFPAPEIGVTVIVGNQQRDYKYYKASQGNDGYYYYQIHVQ